MHAQKPAQRWINQRLHYRALFLNHYDATERAFFSDCILYKIDLSILSLLHKIWHFSLGIYTKRLSHSHTFSLSLLHSGRVRCIRICISKHPRKNQKACLLALDNKKCIA